MWGCCTFIFIRGTLHAATARVSRPAYRAARSSCPYPCPGSLIPEKRSKVRHHTTSGAPTINGLYSRSSPPSSGYSRSVALRSRETHIGRQVAEGILEHASGNAHEVSRADRVAIRKNVVVAEDSRYVWRTAAVYRPILRAVCRLDLERKHEEATDTDVSVVAAAWLRPRRMGSHGG